MQGGRVRASASQIRLAEVDFMVRESGRNRMLRGLPKNVHAYAIGHLVDFIHPQEDRCLGVVEGRDVIYDPYRFSTFVDGETFAPVTEAAMVHFGRQGAQVIDSLDLVA